jgi:hypothetical protein
VPIIKTRIIVCLIKNIMYINNAFWVVINNVARDLSIEQLTLTNHIWKGATAILMISIRKIIFRFMVNLFR